MLQQNANVYRCKKLLSQKICRLTCGFVEMFTGLTVFGCLVYIYNVFFIFYSYRLFFSQITVTVKHFTKALMKGQKMYNGTCKQPVNVFFTCKQNVYMFTGKPRFWQRPLSKIAVNS